MIKLDNKFFNLGEGFMQTGARYRAVYEILEEVFKDQNPADNIINTYVRDRKYIGSKDRRFIVETVWDIIRHRRSLNFDAGSSDVRKILLVYLKNEDLDILFGVGDYALPPIGMAEKNWLNCLKDEPYPLDVEAECPKWLFDKIKDAALLKALNEPATADLRINALTRDAMIEKLRSEGLFFSPTPYSPIGIRSSERVNLNNCAAYHDGEIDVQDEASQLAAILANPRPGLKIMDYCAGAGGKSLTMAYLMQNKGRVYVHDINRGRLEAIKDRSKRLNAREITIVDTVSDTDYDLFVVDAPCSGSGTWRRSPDAKFRLTAERLCELSRIQGEILEKAYLHTQKSGRIAYFTCSILEEENEAVVRAFLSRHSDMTLVSLPEIWAEKIGGRYPFASTEFARFSPLTTGTDGFFAAVMVKS